MPDRSTAGSGREAAVSPPIWEVPSAANRGSIAAMQEVVAWALGMAAGGTLALVGGRLVVPRFYARTVSMLWDDLRASAIRQKKEPPVYDQSLDPGKTAHVTGYLERSIFTAVVILTPPEAAFVAMGTWLGLKMAATWNKPAWLDIPVEIWDRHAFLALQAGLVSMAFAGAGGGLAIFLHDLLLRCS